MDNKLWYIDTMEHGIAIKEEETTDTRNIDKSPKC